MKRGATGGENEQDGEHPTPNIQHPMPNEVHSSESRQIGCSLLDVGCWMFHFPSIGRRTVTVVDFPGVDPI